jgi:hypothetical protein
MDDLLDYLTVKMKALRSFETSISFYQCERYNIIEDLNIQQRRCENLDSCLSFISIFLWYISVPSDSTKYIQFIKSEM